MDKTKILIIGAGRRSRLMMDLLDGYRNLFDVEMQELPKIPVVKKADILIYEDEHTLLGEMDFSHLEDLMYARPIIVGNVGIFHNPPVTIGNALRGVYDYVPHLEPADHPSRKREPKGPRNKWGKIK